MPMRLHDSLHTMARSYAQMCQGEEPWVALGNFMNDWFAYAKDRRSELVADPPGMPEEAPLDLMRWAVFIAASVEWLCARYQIPCPAWVHDPRYCLAEPWWYAPNAEHPAVRAWLISTTPEPFTRRNIYCGDRVYANKYELDDLVAKLKEIRAKKRSMVAETSVSPSGNQ